ncbi:hypothetical protein AALP_AA6G089800 [Arabis alpina]|uniref:Uncharacterized protein n=1 Tax=Arabis alpina TaxID=50452 RepID=A0A087GN12_ARAAL|nr:hypothetical protein AALP_AA6G089800 [Arabis alpina]
MIDAPYGYKPNRDFFKSEGFLFAQEVTEVYKSSPTRILAYKYSVFF